MTIIWNIRLQGQFSLYTPLTLQPGGSVDTNMSFWIQTHLNLQHEILTIAHISEKQRFHRSKSTSHAVSPRSHNGGVLQLVVEMETLLKRVSDLRRRHQLKLVTNLFEQRLRKTLRSSLGKNPFVSTQRLMDCQTQRSAHATCADCSEKEGNGLIVPAVMKKDAERSHLVDLTLFPQILPH